MTSTPYCFIQYCNSVQSVHLTLSSQQFGNGKNAPWGIWWATVRRSTVGRIWRRRRWAWSWLWRVRATNRKPLNITRLKLRKYPLTDWLSCGFTSFLFYAHICWFCGVGFNFWERHHQNELFFVHCPETQNNQSINKSCLYSSHCYLKDGSSIRDCSLCKHKDISVITYYNHLTASFPGQPG